MFEVSFGNPWNVDQDWDFSATHPLRTFSADSLEEIPSFVRTAENEAEKGFWVAVLLSYEGAPAFDTALKTRNAGDFPLAVAAVFSGDRPAEPLMRNQSYRIGEWKSQLAMEDFLRSIAAIRDRIARGDTYQVNYTFPLVAEFDGDPKHWYRELCYAQQAKYCAYLDLGRYKILSLSPELFFARHGNRITTRPMKGTIGRGRWLAEDEEKARTLANSTKDRAENVMIVDLLRNDLGRVALPGTVQVSKLFELERYPTLWQMTSTIEAILKPETNLLNLMSALFPCGSITGAPKVSTMEIIRELEHWPRNIYTGTIGLIQPGGNCSFNVAIRTLLLDSERGMVTFGVGGGVTYDSNAESEYRECVLKSSFLRVRNEPFDLLESILLENGNYFLLTRHLTRLRASATYFGFPFNERHVSKLLEEVSSEYNEGNWKVRLLSSASGEVDCEVTRVVASTQPVKVRLAEEAVDTANPSLYHKKTSNYQAVSRQLKLSKDLDDLIFWNENGEVTESGVANLVRDVNGQLVTPPVACGLLPGTFRAELLAEGKIVEGKIRVEELRAVRQFFLINSVHRWRAAEWAD